MEIANKRAWREYISYEIIRLQMHQILTLFLLALAASPSQAVTDRSCGSDLSRLWLDIVFVVDNSKNMNLYNVYNTISNLFNPFVQIGTGYDDPRSTRVGFITYNWNATDVADFYKLQSYSDLSSQIQALSVTPLSRADETYIDTGLQAAINMINATGGLRDNYKKVVVLFTSKYNYYHTYPEDLTDYLKSTGVTIITVNTGGDSYTTQSLRDKIASKGMAFAMSDGNTTAELQKAVLAINCFCRPGWMQYHYPLKSDNIYSNYGVCLYRPDSAMTKFAAQSYCHSLTTNGYLVSELDQQKRAFNWDYLNSKGITINAFYNGLTNYNGTWWWDQPSGQPLWPLNPNSGAPPQRSGCVVDMKYSDGSISWTPISCTSFFRFLCESVACDTDNYCEF
ncbi:C-type lectin domain-containing protein [Caenorhabditis elegans]|uniref:C-type lectin domain-containing protein n=1 Tax=Caenorhabditis elegans TaxID=6239 RepID=O45445_CAEEL|nr:C-type lectin domain-containing protein [Caenorhabditis elegans]CAB03059.1 C-type lectin domain-containing protein [Caenorhabditis elegans]|eukprot:NP_496746.1 C-type LECtin [Caenorhabditis elegans]